MQRKKENLKKALVDFLERIDINSVRLYQLNFVSEAQGEAWTEGNKKIEIEVDISVKTLIKSESQVEFIYKFTENFQMYEKTLNIKLSYLLSIEVREGKLPHRNVLNAYAKNSGMLLVYPYIRHTVDMLKREAGFILPPLPHKIIK